ANYNQGNTGFCPQMVANQIRLLEFPPVQNNQNNFNRGNNFPQNRGGNFNQSTFNQSQLHRPQVNQAPAYHAPIPQTPNVSQTDFERYVKANDVVLRNIQSQGQSTQNQCQNIQNQYQTVQNQLANLTDMMSKFMSSNMASSLGSGTLPGNTVTNPKEDLKGITTRSGVAYQGPTIPTPSKVAKQGTEVTKDQVQTSNSQSTAPIQPTVIQSEPKTLVSEPVVALVSVSMPNLKPSIPYPSRHDTERRRDHANEQIEKFYKIFKEMSFEISFTDALMFMPKFASTLKALIGNKEKLSEMARTPMNEHCSTIILNKLPKKLGDPKKFLIPCEFPGMDECLALADLADAFLGLEDDPDSPKLDPSYYDLEGDILSLEAILNSDPSHPLLNHEKSVPSFKEELKACEANTIKSSIDEPPEVELKDLPPHLEYAFL
nr:reverse transcriptase domain-containing protein [Tanacetum cinerariifolium]